MAPRKNSPKPEIYKTEDGDYLDIEERDDYYIAWYLPTDGDFGAIVGEDPQIGSKPPENKDDWECWIAHKTVQALADGQDDHGFFFEGIKKARLALAAANEALLSGHAPWPAWAITAKDAGWTPPEGWKP
jgi:hypothetical protein